MEALPLLINMPLLREVVVQKLFLVMEIHKQALHRVSIMEVQHFLMEVVIT